MPSRLLSACVLLLLIGCVGEIFTPVDSRRDAGVTADAGPTPDGGGDFQGLPCELTAMLAQRCGLCHGTPLSGGAQFALDTRDQLLAISPGFGGQTQAMRSLARMRQGTMPPVPGTISAAETEILNRWLTAGSPGGACALPVDAGEEVPASLTRNSTAVVAARLKVLFPSFDTLRLTEGRGTGQALGQGDQFDRFSSYRATDALAQRAARDLILELCATPETLFDEAGVWLAGEAPADGGSRWASVAARKAWGVPVEPSDPSVTALSDLAVELSRDGATDHEVKQELCVAALLAPQFWLGHDSEAQKLSRLSTSLAGRVPTAAEWRSYRDGTLDLSVWVKALQTEPGYVTTVADWHRS